jgi:hypothetical protein
MSQPIFQLAYLSERHEHVSDLDIVDGIVLPAITKNRSLGVTGCLWFDQNHFFQVLEGARDAIEALFEVIARDARHATVTLLLTEETGERRFERFGMRSIDSEAARSLPELIDAFTGAERNGDQATPRRGDRFPKWASWVGRYHKAASERAEGSNPRTLVRMVIDELAGWSDATPA